jgi:hypothetical protein
MLALLKKSLDLPRQVVWVLLYLSECKMKMHHEMCVSAWGHFEVLSMKHRTGPCQVEKTGEE